MDVEQFLRLRDADMPAIVEKANATIGLGSTDVLLVVGSLVEGLGNAKSDLDLLLITDRDASSLPSREIPLVIGRCLSDVLIVGVPELRSLVTRLGEWAAQPWTISHAASFTLEERRLLHRLLHSFAVFDGRQEQDASWLPQHEQLARLKLHVARHLSRTIQVDMVGHRDDGDYASMTFAAQELLGHAVDALTAGHLLTNPTAKWRSRLLGRVEPDWQRALGIRQTGASAPDFFWHLHRAPAKPGSAFALVHSFRIASFARAAFAWAESRFPAGAPSRLDTAVASKGASAKSGDAPLPFLDFDVDFLREENSVYLGRLNEFEEPLELSPLEFALTLQFDGTTTAEEAAARLRGTHPHLDGKTLIEELINKTTAAGFCIQARQP